MTIIRSPAFRAQPYPYYDQLRTFAPIFLGTHEYVVSKPL